MENNDKTTASLWIDEKMSALDPGPAWQPDIAQGLATFRARRAAHDTRGRRWTWAVAAATAVCLCIPALSVTRTFAARCVEACVGVTTRVGEIFRPVQTAERASRLVAANGVRPVAPDFTLTDASGDRLQLSALRGKVVLVNFWATWCAPCKVEIPWFGEFQSRYRDQGLAVVGISLDEDGWTSVRAFAERQPINYRIAIGSTDLSNAYGGLLALPATFIVDRQGRIAGTHVGIVAKGDYEDELTRVLAEE